MHLLWYSASCLSISTLLTDHASLGLVSALSRTTPLIEFVMLSPMSALSINTDEIADTSSSPISSLLINTAFIHDLIYLFLVGVIHSQNLPYYIYFNLNFLLLLFYNKNQCTINEAYLSTS